MVFSITALSSNGSHKRVTYTGLEQGYCIQKQCYSRIKFYDGCSVKRIYSTLTTIGVSKFLNLGRVLSFLPFLSLAIPTHFSFLLLVLSPLPWGETLNII